MSRQDYGSGSIAERSPGRWQVTVSSGRDPRTGKRQRRRFTVLGVRRDAQQALREALRQRDSGLMTSADKVAVGEWLTAWLARHDAEGHISPRTHDRYRGILERHLIPGLGRLRLQQLRPDHLADLKAQWLSGDGDGQPLAGATIHKHFVVLRQALADAVTAGVILRNPADAVSAPSAKATTERRALTEDEIANLLTASRGSRYDAPIRITLATGMRQGELLAIRWEDMDLDAGLVTVRRTLSYVSGEIMFRAPKTANSRRTIEISGPTIQLLRAHRIRQAEHRLQLGTLWQENGLVFPSLIGTPWLARPFYRGYRGVLARSEIRDVASVNWHTLRHTAASQWLRRGADVFSVSRRLGHASAAFTMDVYAHLLKGQQKQAAEALDYLLAEA